jgi:small subunit ribosomal protein S1
VPIEEFKNDQGEIEVQVGDFVSVAIDAIENGYGDTILSRDKAKRLASWLSLENALESGEFVTGTVSGKVKGGLTVLVNGIRAFLPGSLLDTRPVKDMSPFEGKTMEFKVIKLDRKRNNVVLSRRAVVEASMGEERAKLLETLSEGAIVHGVVKNITEYGAFVDLGGIDGLLHITDMAWRRVRHPSEVVTVGQELTAKVLKFDAEKNRVSLGLKQLGDDPWIGVSRRYPTHPPVRQGHQHRRLRCLRRDRTGHRRPGARLRDGLDQQERRSRQGGHPGRGSRSHGPGNRRGQAPHQPGHEAVPPNPWEEFSQNFKRGDRVKGPVKSITDFGVFVGLAAGIDGLVHLSTCPGTSRARPPCATTRRARKSKPSCWPSTWSASASAWASSSSTPIRSPASPRSMTVAPRWSARSRPSTRAAPRSSSTKTSPATCVPARSSRDRVEDARNVLKEGDEVTALVINVDRKMRSIQLSIKAKDNADAAGSHAAPVRRPASVENAGTTSLGALLRPSWTRATRSSPCHPASRPGANRPAAASVAGPCPGLPAILRRRRATSGDRPAPPGRHLVHSEAMTRSDLVTLLAERFRQLTQRDTEFAVKTMLDAMSDALARGHRIEIRGFGSFSHQPAPAPGGPQPAHRRAGASFPKSWCPTSSPARPCARRWTSPPPMRKPRWCM